MRRYLFIPFYICVCALLWDARWHITYGRDSFWIPPHDVLYLSLVFILLVTILSRDIPPRSKHITYGAFVIIGLAAPFDQFWHAVFGKELIESPFIIWSPPHVMLLIGLMTIFAGLWSAARLETDQHHRRISKIFLLASLAGILFIVTSPLYPLGPWHILGMWGSLFVSLAVILVLFISKISEPSVWSPFGVVAILLISSSFSPATVAFTQASELAPVFSNPPFGLLIMGYLVMAFLISISEKHNAPWQGTMAGLLSGAFLYLIAIPFLSPALLTIKTGYFACLGSGLGGLIAGTIIRYWPTKPRTFAQN